MKNILQICQDAASLVATQKPQDLFNDGAQQEAIFLSVAQDTLDSLLRYGDWQELIKEAQFRTIAGKSSYLLQDICEDFYCLVNNTIYVKDCHEKVIGAITPEQWMQEKYFSVPSIGIKFKLQNGFFKFLTPPAENLKIVFQYRSANIVYASIKGIPGAAKPTLSANTDIPIFDEYLVKKGIVWRWYRRNGMPYEEEYNEYQREIKSKFGTTLATGDIFLADTFPVVSQGVVINAAKNS